MLYRDYGERVRIMGCRRVVAGISKCMCVLERLGGCGEVITIGEQQHCIV